jgi:hypothetical protein
MGLVDTLEGLFHVEGDATMESILREFVTGGENIWQKTELPFDEKVIALAFLKHLGKAIDTEFRDIISVLNQSEGLIVKGGKVPKDYEYFSSSIPMITTDTALMMPSLRAKSLERLMKAIRAIREERIEIKKPDTVDKIMNR